MADNQFGGVTWADVAAALRDANDQGLLAPIDQSFLTQAESRAAQEGQRQ